MEIFDLLAEHQALFIALTFAYSLLIGSFLNVVIYRLPIMLEREWRKQAQDILSGSAEAQASDAQAEISAAHAGRIRAKKRRLRRQ